MRAATPLWISQARKWFLNIEVARDFYVAKQRISTSWGVCRHSDARGELAPSAALRLMMVACITARNQTFASYLSVKLSVLPLHADLPWKSPCRLQSCPAQELCSRYETEPSSRTSDCMYDRRSIDGSGSANRKGQLPHVHDDREACRSLRTLPVLVDSQLQSQAAGETHIALLRPSWKRKPFLIYVFRIWSLRMFI